MPSGSGFSGFLTLRLINQLIGAMIAPYKSTTKSDLELFSSVTSSDEDINFYFQRLLLYISAR